MTNLIMLVEDDMDHAELVIRALTEHRITNCIRHFLDGKSALDYLFRRNGYDDPAMSPRPRIILLDLHLPRVDGIEVLITIKASEELRVIPVVILTTSSAEKDIACAYSNHANSYLVKPLGCEEFLKLMENLCFYWLGSNTLLDPK